MVSPITTASRAKSRVLIIRSKDVHHGGPWRSMEVFLFPENPKNSMELHALHGEKLFPKN
jgi:hypothetical protein